MFAMEMRLHLILLHTFVAAQMAAVRFLSAVHHVMFPEVCPVSIDYPTDRTGVG